jgi:precorrin-6B methylase 2
LVSALNISSGERALDIGAGTGRLAAYVAKIVGPFGALSASTRCLFGSKSLNRSPFEILKRMSAVLKICPHLLTQPSTWFI